MAIDLTFRRVAAVLIAITSTGLVAQTPAAPSAPVDLSSPALQAHASLPLNDQPGVPLNDMLVGTQPRATALGLSNDLTGGPIDEVVVSPSGGPHISDIYQQRTCKADAIIIGHITNSASHLNTSGTTVYTDYDFVLDGILKDNAQARIAPRKDIVVTRIGGSISLPNGTITYNHGGFPPFQPTATYLVFASYIPASGGYVAMDRFATLVRNGGQWNVARKAYSTVSDPILSVGSFEVTIGSWLRIPRDADQRSELMPITIPK